jgi:hypothetical protein
MKERQSTPVWLWLNLLSLDAPLVAILWQQFLQHCYPSVLRPAAQLMLGLCVWAIYLADRLLDVRSPSSGPETLAHRFCRQNHKLARTLLGAVLCANFLVAFLWLRPPVFSNGLVVSAGVITYFGAFPVGRVAPRWKPVSAAVLFTTGVFLVAWTNTANPAATLTLPAVTFCLLCLANLILIGLWERKRIGSSRDASYAIVWILALAAVCAFFAPTAWYKAIALSAAGLGGLALLENKVSHAASRVLADAVLLSPLLFLWKSAA